MVQSFVRASLPLLDEMPPRPSAGVPMSGGLTIVWIWPQAEEMLWRAAGSSRDEQGGILYGRCFQIQGKEAFQIQGKEAIVDPFGREERPPQLALYAGPQAASTPAYLVIPERDGQGWLAAHRLSGEVLLPEEPGIHAAAIGWSLAGLTLLGWLWMLYCLAHLS